MGPAPAAQTAKLPAPDHVAVVVFENHAYEQVTGSSSAPYLNNTLMTGGGNLTSSYAITHPSQPNYLDRSPATTRHHQRQLLQLAVQQRREPRLRAHRRRQVLTRFYSEGLPSQGSTVCTNSSTKYAQKHNPWSGPGF